MAHSTIERYISDHYEEWRTYARRQCSWRGLYSQADEILSDAVMVLLEKDEQTVIEMIRKEHIGGNWLDAFMCITIQYKCLARRRKRSIDRRMVKGLEIERLDIAEPEIEDPVGYDVCGKMNIVRELLPTLKASDAAKRTFEFIVIQGGSYADLPNRNTAGPRVSRIKKALRQAISAGNY